MTSTASLSVRREQRPDGPDDPLQFVMRDELVGAHGLDGDAAFQVQRGLGEEVAEHRA